MPKNQKYVIAESDLRQMYEVDFMTINQISESIGCSPPVVTARLAEYGIPKRKSPKKGRKYGHIVHKNINYDDVVDLYVNKKLSMRDVGKALGCSAPTVAQFLNERGIKRRHHNDTKRGATSPRKIWINPELVIHHYSKSHSSAAAVGRMFGVSSTVISRILKEEAVTTKPAGECFNRYGKNNPNYKPNLTDAERALKRDTHKSSIWRESVYKRDCYTCQCCGDNAGGNLEAHHIVPYSKDKDARWDVDNGITMCNKCHRRYHSKYGVNNCNRKTLLEFTEWVKSP